MNFNYDLTRVFIHALLILLMVAVTGIVHGDWFGGHELYIPHYETDQAKNFSISSQYLILFGVKPNLSHFQL